MFAIRYTYTVKQGPAVGSLEVTKFVTSTKSFSLSEDADESARFVHAESAIKALKDLRKRGFEKNGDLHVVFLAASVAQVILVPRNEKSGFVIKRTNGPASKRFYTGYKTKPADGFYTAHYKWCADKNSATVFPTRAAAEKALESIKKALESAAERERLARELESAVGMGSTLGSTYQTIAQEFAAIIVKI